jgi:hypothetical protein
MPAGIRAVASGIGVEHEPLGARKEMLRVIGPETQIKQGKEVGRSHQG